MWWSLCLVLIASVAGLIVLVPVLVALLLRWFPTPLAETETVLSRETTDPGARHADAVAGMREAGLRRVGRFRSPAERGRTADFVGFVTDDRLVLGIVWLDSRFRPWSLLTLREDGRFWETGPEADLPDLGGLGIRSGCPEGWSVADALLSHRSRLLVATAFGPHPVRWEPPRLAYQMLQHERRVAEDVIASGHAVWVRRDDPGGRCDLYRWRTGPTLRVACRSFVQGLMEPAYEALEDVRKDATRSPDA